MLLYLKSRRPNPKVLVLDESLTGLDLPVQAQIVNLLLDLQASMGVSYLFISHDLRLATHFADDLVVMKDGCIVESGPAQEVARHPQHPHTRVLMDAVGALKVERSM
jgi:ABC-type glutathione transport system ATPase component